MKLDPPFEHLTEILAENDYFVAALEPKPLAKGHVLIIAKSRQDHFFDLSDEVLASAMKLAREISKVLRANVECEKIGMAVLGLETRQAHLHLVPLQKADDLNFTRSRSLAQASELAEVKKWFQAKPIV